MNLQAGIRSSSMFTGLVLLLLSVTPAAQDKPGPEADPAMERFLRGPGWTDVSGEIHMRVSSDGDRLKRILMRTAQKEEEQLFRLDFLEPPKLDGMKFVAIIPRSREDQWMMYVRAIRRVLNVPLNAENHMVRDMMNLGFLRPRPEFFIYKSTTETLEISGKSTRALDAVPRDGDAVRQFGFDRARLWVEPETGLVWRTDFISKDRVVRIQEVSAWDGPSGDFPRMITARDLDGDQITRVEMKELKFNQSLAPDLFTRRDLSRK